MNNQFTIPALPYSTDSLAPVISKETISYHYGKHLQAYIDNLNRLKEGTQFESADLKTIIKESNGALFNNAAQTFNHTFYFLNISPAGGGMPKGELLKAIEAKWQSFDDFKKIFTDTATGLFGSGWVWLQCNPAGELSVAAEPNADNPLTKGLIPLMTIDVWEHAYYLDHQNRRAEYVNGFWNIIDWNSVEENYKQASSGGRCCKMCKTRV
ncbi:MAG: superoxide dismutase [Bacteroidales bacterium]|nr:superoxide dismutase [Bacteroidales bacterium]